MADQPADLEELQRRLGHRFSDTALLEGALLHRSWCAENPGPSSNERLEFLGDSVLGLAVTNHIYREFDELPEGQLAKLRASVVSAQTLAELAGRLELGRHLRLGKGEEGSGGRQKHSILADAMEAVIGAVYLDAGWERANHLVIGLLSAQIATAAERPGRSDYKTRLQERVAQRHGGAPRYVISESGPDHAKRFLATVTVDGVELGEGSGTSKKEAEQAAARNAWESTRAGVG